MPRRGQIVVFLLVSLVILRLCTGLVAAEALPQPQGFVNDFSGVIDRRSQAEIEAVAQKLQDEQGIELAVVTVENTGSRSPKDYAVELFNHWGIGGPEDSGLLILLSLGERRIEVEVGYGLEELLPDGKVGAILDRFVVSHLSQGDYGRGLAAGVRAFADQLSGAEFEKSQGETAGQASDWLRTFVIFVLIAIFISIQARRRPPGGPPGQQNGRRYFGGGSFGGPRLPRTPGGRPGGGFGGFGGGRSGGGGAGRKF